jgi:hypothetical protein
MKFAFKMGWWQNGSIFIGLNLSTLTKNWILALFAQDCSLRAEIRRKIIMA